jgi:transcriptional regulator with PAS, ATPase and Fis domain
MNKLLQAIEDKKFLPIGARDMVKVDVRFMATTNADLGQMMRAVTFREDLFYRLNEMVLVLPPLRERASDVLLLAEYFLRKYCREFRREYQPFDRQTASRFVEYDWPGNVRELENTVKRGVVQGCFEPVRASFEQPEGRAVAGSSHITGNGGPTASSGCVKGAKLGAERQVLIEALSQCRYHRTRTAAHLGISYRTLLRWMKKHNVDV